MLDHIVYAAPDVEEAVLGLERDLGVRASPGGSHPGLGTHNALLALSDQTYLEVIGPDPNQPPPEEPRPFGIDSLRAPQLAGWAAKATNLEERVKVARARGYDPGSVRSMQRQLPQAPQGTRLEWRLTLPSAADGRNPPAATGNKLLPFLIDWGESPHPARTAAPGCRMLEWYGEHPDVPAVRRLLDALGVELEVREAPTPALVAVLQGPRGQVVLA